MTRDDRAAATFGVHLDPEELAILAEGQRPSPQVVEHLAQCRSCMSAYADVVRYRAATLVFPDAFEDSDPGPWTAVGRARARWLALAACLVVGLGIALTLGTIRRQPAARDPISALLERSSGQGLVLPGGEAGAVGATLAYRSGRTASEDAEQAVEALRTRYEREPARGREVTRLAAGLVALGRLDLARDYVAEGLAATPQSAPLLTLAGIVAYRNGDDAQAERHLRDAVMAAPGDLTAALDLGLLLCERREPESAKPCLERVSRQSPRSPLAQRARAALAECGRH